MEGGSPSLIWQRWTLPMYYAQQRYWGDNPRPNELLRLLVAAKYKLPERKKTPPPQRNSERRAKPDWSALNEPIPGIDVPFTGTVVPYRLG